MATVTQRQIDRLAADVGDLLARNERARGRDFRRYAQDPVGFLRDVLGAEPWTRQVEIAEALRDEAQVTVRSCHAAGKDWLAARLALWWVYARRGLVVLTGPTAAQVEEVLMRNEIRQAFLAGGLPGELHVRALRPTGTGEAGILARTGTDVHSLTGLHRARVLYIVTEAQDPDLDHAWDAGFAVTTGEHDRFLALGNPTEPDGRFFRSHQPGSGWLSLKVAAEDVPNVQQGRTVVPGLMTREGVERFRREYGEESSFYVSRVLAEFPAESTDALVTAAMLDRATSEDTALRLRDSEGYRRAHHVLGVDPARLGPDTTAVCVRRGPVVEGFEPWRGADTMASADRVRAIVRQILDGYDPGRGGGAVEVVRVDEVGLGGGLLDRLRETLPREDWSEYHLGVLTQRIARRHPEAEGFSASRSGGTRYRNARAAAFWRLRKLLEDGELALPNLPELREELLAHRVRFGADGRIEIASKDDVKARIGRSPDLADALVISVYDGAEEDPGEGYAIEFA